jgi:RNA polymerase sigma-70 factor, ECF subfamily
VTAVRSDEQLLHAARQGDRQAIEELLARHEQQIYRFGLRMCGDEESAREVLQETLLAAFRNLPGFRGDAALSTWLYQIARSFCIKERRRDRPEVPLDEHAGSEASPAPGPEQDAQAREIGRALASAIRALPAEHREALVLRDVEGLSAEEAAQVAGIEVGALKSRLHRARMELRGHLAALLGEQQPPGGAAPCAELAQQLSAYAAQEIDQATCSKIEEHLASCPRCAGACAALKQTVSLCRRIPGDQVPAPVRAAVRRALLSLTPAT